MSNYSDIRIMTTDEGYELLCSLSEEAAKNHGRPDLMKSTQINMQAPGRVYFGWNSFNHWDRSSPEIDVIMSGLEKLEEQGLSYTYSRIGEELSDIEERIEDAGDLLEYPAIKREFDDDYIKNLYKSENEMVNLNTQDNKNMTRVSFKVQPYVTQYGTLTIPAEENIEDYIRDRLEETDLSTDIDYGGIDIDIEEIEAIEDTYITPEQKSKIVLSMEPALLDVVCQRINKQAEKNILKNEMVEEWLSAQGLIYEEKDYRSDGTFKYSPTEEGDLLGISLWRGRLSFDINAQAFVVANISEILKYDEYTVIQKLNGPDRFFFDKQRGTVDWIWYDDENNGRPRFTTNVFSEKDMGEIAGKSATEVFDIINENSSQWLIYEDEFPSEFKAIKNQFLYDKPISVDCNERTLEIIRDCFDEKYKLNERISIRDQLADAESRTEVHNAGLDAKVNENGEIIK